MLRSNTLYRGIVTDMLRMYYNQVESIISNPLAGRNLMQSCHSEWPALSVVPERGP